MNDKTVVRIDNLSVNYNQNEALSGVSFSVERGDFIGLVGPNGGGKTTLAKAMLKLIPFSSGSIEILGSDIKNFRNFNKIGYLPQKNSGINYLFPASVEEVVSLGLISSFKTSKPEKRNAKEKISGILKTLDIQNIRHKLLSELSGGQQQKVLLARALVSKPEIIIFDEPSTALDPNSRESFFALIKQLHKTEKTTVILITHDTGYIGKYADKLLYLDRRILFFGSISQFCPSGENELCFEKNDQHIIWHLHR